MHAKLIIISSFYCSMDIFRLIVTSLRIILFISVANQYRQSFELLLHNICNDVLGVFRRARNFFFQRGLNLFSLFHCSTLTLQLFIACRGLPVLVGFLEPDYAKYRSLHLPLPWFLHSSFMRYQNFNWMLWP